MIIFYVIPNLLFLQVREPYSYEDRLREPLLDCTQPIFVAIGFPHLQKQQVRDYIKYNHSRWQTFLLLTNNWHISRKAPRRLSASPNCASDWKNRSRPANRCA